MERPAVGDERTYVVDVADDAEGARRISMDVVAWRRRASAVSRGSGPGVAVSQSARSITTNSSPSGSWMLSSPIVMAMVLSRGERAARYPHRALTLIIHASGMEVKVSDMVTAGETNDQRFFGAVGTESPLVWSRPPGRSSKRAS